MIESVNITGDKVVSYPLHRHSFCEIMYYIEGTGCLKTEYGDYPFAPKTAIIVPRNILHGSVSDNGFKNISVGGDFGNVIVDSNPIVISSVADSEILCRLIYKNRFGNQEYLNALADCYAISLMQAYNYESQINTAVKKIVNTISENACDPEFSITNELNLSGYAEDYIRAKFKEICGETPIEFLNRLRIKNACRIIEIYGNRFNITETAARSGFSNPAYFSRVFKKTVGICPNKYSAKADRQILTKI